MFNKHALKNQYVIMFKKTYIQKNARMFNKHTFKNSYAIMFNKHTFKKGICYHV